MKTVEILKRDFKKYNELRQQAEDTRMALQTVLPKSPTHVFCIHLHEDNPEITVWKSEALSSTKATFGLVEGNFIIIDHGKYNEESFLLEAADILNNWLNSEVTL